jgi:hypothetical protein
MVKVIFSKFEPMIQTVLVILFFTGALAYVIRLIYKNFQAKSGCSSGCAKCSIDFDKIEQQLQQKKG